MHTIFAVFESSVQAQSAIKQLEVEGLDPKDVAIVFKNTLQKNLIDNLLSTELFSGSIFGGLIGFVISLVIVNNFGIIINLFGMSSSFLTVLIYSLIGFITGGILLTFFTFKNNQIIKNKSDSINYGGILVAVAVSELEDRRAKQILTNNSASVIRSLYMDRNRSYLGGYDFNPSYNDITGLNAQSDEIYYSDIREYDRSSKLSSQEENLKKDYSEKEEKPKSENMLNSLVNIIKRLFS